MQVLDADLLVKIVTLLATEAKPLVTGDDVRAWCGKKENGPVEYGIPHGEHFHEADLDEARGRHRLQKFRETNARTAQVAWALVSMCPRARDWARQNGWLIDPWVCDNWDWSHAYPP
jgi:hypothetical protein